MGIRAMEDEVGLQDAAREWPRCPRRPCRATGLGFRMGSELEPRVVVYEAEHAGEDDHDVAPERN